MSRLVHSLFILALNAVPLVGVLSFGWSAATLLIVVWVEVLLVGVGNVARIWLHREWTKTRGHYRRHFNNRSPATLLEKSKRPVQSGTLLGEYATLAFVFTLGHGLFLGIILVLSSRNFTGDGPSPWAIDITALERGILAVLGLTIFELFLDLAVLRRKPFYWVKERVQVSMGQVVIVHLAILFGMFLLMYLETPLVFLGIIIGLKALMELGMAGQKRELPATPPRWLSSIARRQGLDLEREWTRYLAEEKQQLIDDELPFRE
jgi:hypothetical protein